MLGKLVGVAVGGAAISCDFRRRVVFSTDFTAACTSPHIVPLAMSIVAHLYTIPVKLVLGRDESPRTQNRLCRSSSVRYRYRYVPA